MRAVNLIPLDAPGGRVDRGGRSGGAVYALLATLAVLLLGVTAYVLAGNRVAAHQDELAALQTQATAVQVQAERLRPYTEFAALVDARVQTVRQLGAARFDWHRALADLATVLPENVWLTSVLGTVTPGVSVEGGASGASSAVRSALPNPAIELTGCTTSHEGVVRLISRLRLMEGVERVSLADSVKQAGGASGGGGGGGGTSGDCRHGNESFPQFNMVVFFAPLAAPPAASQPGAATAAASVTTPPAAATPASSGTTSGSDVR